MKKENNLKVVTVKKNSKLYQEIEKNGALKHKYLFEGKELEQFIDACSWGQWKPLTLRIIETDNQIVKYSEITAVQYENDYSPESTRDIRAPYDYLEYLIDTLAWANSEWGEYDPRYKEGLNNCQEIYDMLEGKGSDEE